jgi:hypothetical protein
VKFTEHFAIIFAQEQSGTIKSDPVGGFETDSWVVVKKAKRESRKLTNPFQPCPA